MRDTRRVIIVMETPRRPNPYEVWLLIALFISSLAALLNIAPSPSSITSILPEAKIVVWNLQLCSGSALALFGMWLLRTKRRLKFFGNQAAIARLIKIAGQVWTGTGALIYCCVIFYYGGTEAMLPGLTIGSVAIAAAFRALQLRGQVGHMLQKVGERDDIDKHSSFADGGE